MAHWLKHKSKMGWNWIKSDNSISQSIHTNRMLHGKTNSFQLDRCSKPINVCTDNVPKSYSSFLDIAPKIELCVGFDVHSFCRWTKIGLKMVFDYPFNNASVLLKAISFEAFVWILLVRLRLVACYISILCTFTHHQHELSVCTTNSVRF